MQTRFHLHEGKEARLKAEISGVKAEIVLSESRIRTDLAKVDARVERLEELRLVRP